MTNHWCPSINCNYRPMTATWKTFILSYTSFKYEYIGIILSTYMFLVSRNSRLHYDTDFNEDHTVYRTEIVSFSILLIRYCRYPMDVFFLIVRQVSRHFQSLSSSKSIGESCVSHVLVEGRVFWMIFCIFERSITSWARTLMYNWSLYVIIYLIFESLTRFDVYSLNELSNRRKWILYPEEPSSRKSKDLLYRWSVS